MAKLRVYELARELNVANKDLLNVLAEIGIEVKNHMSSLEDDQVKKIRTHFENKNKPANDVDYNKTEEIKNNNDRGNYMEEQKNVSDLSDIEVINDKYEDLIKIDKPKKKKNKNKIKKEEQQDAHKAAEARRQKNEEDGNDAIVIPETVTVKELSDKSGKSTGDIIKKLIQLGTMATVNQELDFETATIIMDEFGLKIEKEKSTDPEEILKYEEPEDESELVARPPVVVVMGHVDHGKTSLLDAIRHANVTSGEAGGITQHIGAYRVNITGRKITFLDTPGHEAFTAMRARGAQITDIAVLVVAADDGIMPQTVEAINHAKAANINIIVAINKIDKPGADIDKVKQELTEYGLVAEEWGGETICVPVSAKTKEGIENLLEMILLVADMQELKANPHRNAKGTVIEAKLDKQRGPIATFLVQKGTLCVGDTILAGAAEGRVRAMMDDKGKMVKKARPSTPVEVVGLSEVPEAGDLFYALDDEKFARALAEERRQKARQELMSERQAITLENLFSQIEEGKVKELCLIVKADTQGSIEAIRQSIQKLSNDEVKIKIIHGGTGAITESDIMLASASNALVIGFNVRPDVTASSLAERNNVEIKTYRVIYDALNDLEAAMKGMLEPEYREVILGHVQVRSLFKISSVGTIAGSYVTDGKITRNSKVRLLRDNVVIYEGEIATLKRFKDDAKEVATGFECGVLLEKYNDIKENDVIEAYVIEAIPRK